jgi:ribosomal protein L29
VDSNEIAQLNTSWHEKREELKITRNELQQRILALRAELEAYRVQLEDYRSTSLAATGERCNRSTITAKDYSPGRGRVKT